MVTAPCDRCADYNDVRVLSHAIIYIF